MRLKKAAICTAVVSMLCVTGSAIAGDCVPPPNETCAGATVITSQDLPYNITAPLGCFNDVTDKPYFDIFYRYDCTQSGEHQIDLCDSDGDTYIRIYRDGCGWSDGIEFATADDECPGSPPNADPMLLLDLEAGVTYWLELGTWRAEPPWAPPPNSPYHLSIFLTDAETQAYCDNSGIPMTLVGDPGNAADTSTSTGAVPYLYRISQHEVTNRQYVDFLNSVAVTDGAELYNEDMTDSDRGGINRSGAPGSYVYWVKPNFGDKPVNFVSWLDAARFCNWLHNGQPIGPQGPATTEAGTYDMSLPNDQISREPGARWFIPSSDEWYKAAYYDPFDPGADAGGTVDYWLYPTSSDALPTQALADGVGDVTNPGLNVANHNRGADWNGENGNVTTVGGTTSESPWGAFDMGGNLYEVTETLASTTQRETRGGDFANNGILMKSNFVIDTIMDVEAGNNGFRVAALVCPGDFDGDNDVDADDAAAFQACYTGFDGGPLEPLCVAADFDGDGDADCDDWNQFLLAWTEPGDPPGFPQCEGEIPTVSEWGLAAMTLLLLTAGSVILARRRRAAGGAG